MGHFFLHSLYFYLVLLLFYLFFVMKSAHRKACGRKSERTKKKHSLKVALNVNDRKIYSQITNTRAQ